MLRPLVLLAALFATAVHAEPVQEAVHRHVAKPTRHLVEPQLHLADAKGQTPRVALTLDACSGKTDRRILDMLVENRIPATLFVTARWLKHNPEAIAILKQHPDLFEIENHGRDHLAAVDRPMQVYGVRSVGSQEGLLLELGGGADAIVAAGFDRPHWFRGATAKYSRSAIDRIETLGYRIGGYSVNGDGGSLLGAKETARRIAGSRDGDVIISHINQPGHAAGAGVVEGVLALRKRGFQFVLLRGAAEPETQAVAHSETSTR